MTIKAYNTILTADVIVGYKTYLHLLQPILQQQEVVGTGMTKEVERCQKALELAASGKKVAVVSSGDPGVYGMAGLILELAAEQKLLEEIDISIVPGVTAANAGAAVLGAPLMHDLSIISLSDLLTPWELILKRLEAAAASDFVLVLYNPKSHKRVEQILKAQEIVMKYRSGDTPVGVVKNALRAGEEMWISDLQSFTALPIDMFTVVIIGNSQTKVQAGRMITPRGYTW
ncbi:precorrin-3B C(17)-methyltransferase [Zhaonella formicivorans]|jgi:precorrin-3B C17-methyltransferase|uniref:precorrin-3B C(17)-methyltransferase n=1 Tax=Zhaonella formicivorans TaxID=2528593 RepID=UPI003BF56587